MCSVFVCMVLMMRWMTGGVLCVVSVSGRTVAVCGAVGDEGGETVVQRGRTSAKPGRGGRDGTVWRDVCPRELRMRRRWWSRDVAVMCVADVVRKVSPVVVCDCCGDDGVRVRCLTCLVAEAERCDVFAVLSLEVELVCLVFSVHDPAVRTCELDR